MKECNSDSIPLRFCHLNADKDAFNKKIYQAIIECLAYFMTAILPDLASTVGVMGQFMSNPLAKCQTDFVIFEGNP